MRPGIESEVRLVLHGALEMSAQGQRDVVLRIPAGQTVKEVLARLDVDPAVVGLILVDGELGGLGTRAGKEIQVYPLVGGG